MSGSLLLSGLQPARLLCSWDLLTRILEWVAISFCSRQCFWPRDRTAIFGLAGRFFATEPPGKLCVQAQLGANCEQDTKGKNPKCHFKGIRRKSRCYIWFLHTEPPRRKADHLSHCSAGPPMALSPPSSHLRDQINHPNPIPTYWMSKATCCFSPPNAMSGVPRKPDLNFSSVLINFYWLKSSRTHVGNKQTKEARL